MFGSIPIFGNSECKVDCKGRIFIPKFSDVEENEQLIIQKGKSNYYIIINWSKIEKEITKLKTLGAEQKLEILTNSIVGLVKTDKQKRILFKPFENFAIDRKVFIHGNYDSLQVFPSQLDYENYIEELKSR